MSDRLPPEIARLLPDGEHLVVGDLTLEQVRALIAAVTPQLLPPWPKMEPARYIEPDRRENSRCNTHADLAATAAVDDVVIERCRHLDEGWTADHDDDGENHSPDDLAMAAVCYALPPRYRTPAAWCSGIPSLWPWNVVAWKPKDRRRDLVRAASLLIAEIDRMDRAAVAAEKAGRT